MQWNRCTMLQIRMKVGTPPHAQGGE
uniref:Uncharacterized protein n=1 Tax=Anguilla anguilla TaxID=7936 RepID=A0A0E9Q375_ANGAN